MWRSLRMRSAGQILNFRARLRMQTMCAVLIHQAGRLLPF